MYTQIKKPSVAICDALKRSGLPLTIFADHVGISYNTMRFWKRGDTMPSLRQAIIVCDYLDISLDEFAGRAKEQPKSVDAFGYDIRALYGGKHDNHD